MVMFAVVIFFGFLWGLAEWPWWLPFLLAPFAAFSDFFAQAGFLFLVGKTYEDMQGSVVAQIAVMAVVAVGGYWIGRAVARLFRSR